jgi:ABC-2 type transport system ATP-binding protein
LRALLEQLDHQNIDVAALTVHTPDLDDVYFALTGHGIKEENPAA